MAWSSPDSVASRLLSGDPIAILVAFLVAVFFPLCLHLFLYRAAVRKPSDPLFVLLGVSGAGKTSLVTLVSSVYFEEWRRFLSVNICSYNVTLSPPAPRSNPPAPLLRKPRPPPDFFSPH